MLEQMISSHNILVQIFLAFLLGGLLIPMMTAKKPLGFRKASFIYTMIFQAIATMIAFSGLIAMITGELGLTLSTILMIVIWAALMYIEIKKYRLIKVARIENPETHKLLKGAFIKISAVQILLVIVMVILKVMEVKGAISLS
jgi:hypothetical protein